MFTEVKTDIGEGVTSKPLKKGASKGCLSDSEFLYDRFFSQFTSDGTVVMIFATFHQGKVDILKI